MTAMNPFGLDYADPAVSSSDVQRRNGHLDHVLASSRTRDAAEKAAKPSRGLCAAILMFADLCAFLLAFAVALLLIRPVPLVWHGSLMLLQPQETSPPAAAFA